MAPLWPRTEKRISRDIITGQAEASLSHAPWKGLHRTSWVQLSVCSQWPPNMSHCGLKNQVCFLPSRLHDRKGGCLGGSYGDIRTVTPFSGLEAGEREEEEEMEGGRGTERGKGRCKKRGRRERGKERWKERGEREKREEGREKEEQREVTRR